MESSLVVDAIALIESRNNIPKANDWGLMAAAAVLAQDSRMTIIGDLRTSQAAVASLTDAARYRWLKSKLTAPSWLRSITGEYDDLDAAIDAAMKSEQDNDATTVRGQPPAA